MMGRISRRTGWDSRFWTLAVLAAVLVIAPATSALANQPPVADAGEDQSVYVYESTLLQGTATDPDGDDVVSWRWTVDSSPAGSSPYISEADIPDPIFGGYPAGDYVLSLTVSDGTDWSGPDTVTIHVAEILPPVAIATADVTSGTAPLTVNFDGSQSYDPQGGDLIFRWYFGDSSNSSEVSPTHVYQFTGTYFVIFGVVDSLGQMADDTMVITVTEDQNHPPVLGGITGAPLHPVSVGTPIDVSAQFTDPDVGDTHTATWDWGDGATDGVDPAASPVGGSHSYDSAGVYTVTLTVTDADGASDEAVFQYVVSYDSSAGFVTGGGWIMSPEGAYVADSGLTGKANFGFVAKYKKGATTPSGQTEFRFKAADFNFHSSQYQWLVVAGPQAKFKGSGTINGAGDYGFMLTGRDGQISGEGVDKFRIKIWDKATNEVVYDNQMGEDDESEATTEIGGGSIVIHKAK